MPFDPSKYLYLPPSRNVLAGKTVTSTAGTPETTEHSVQFLTDRNLALPAKWAAGAWGASVALGGAANQQLFSLVNTSIDATVTVNGGTGSIAAVAAKGNGVRRNGYLMLSSPVSASTTTFAGTNTADTLVCEAFAGVPLELTALKMQSFFDRPIDGMPSDELSQKAGQFLNVPLHDDGIELRLFGGEQTYTTAERDAIEDWYLEQRQGSRPSLMVLDQAVNDARAVLLLEPQFTNGGAKGLWDAQLRWIELPRYRW